MFDWWFALWAWIEALKGGAPQFLGAMTGSFLGLIGILLGALYNAKLNRNRDDRLRQADTRSLIAAITGELTGIRDGLLRNAENLDSPQSDFVAPDLVHSVRLMPEITSKLGLLDAGTIRAVVEIYILIDQYCEALLMAGGRMAVGMPPERRLVRMPQSSAEFVAKFNRKTAEEIQKVINNLKSIRVKHIQY